MAFLDKLLKTLEDVTAKLDEFVEEGYDLNDWRDQMAALHALQVQAQAFLDVAQRLLSNMGTVTEDYREAVRKLRERGLIDEGEERFLRSVVGFRNVVVHEYGDVDLEVANGVLKNREYRRLLEIALRMKQRAKDCWDP